MKKVPDAQPAKPFEKFKRLTERLMAVPERELDQKPEEYERKKKQPQKQKQK